MTNFISSSSPNSPHERTSLLDKKNPKSQSWSSFSRINFWTKSTKIYTPVVQNELNPSLNLTNKQINSCKSSIPLKWELLAKIFNFLESKQHQQAISLVCQQFRQASKYNSIQKELPKYGIPRSVIQNMIYKGSQFDSLDLSIYKKLDDKALNYVAQCCPQLRHIQLSSRHLTDKGIIQLSIHCPNLQSIELRRNKEITNEGIIKFSQNCKSLEKISFFNCPSITSSFIVNLKSKFPNFQIEINPFSHPESNHSFQTNQTLITKTVIKLTDKANTGNAILALLEKANYNFCLIEEINLQNQLNIKNKLLNRLIKSATNLKRVNLNGYTDMTDSILTSLSLKKQLLKELFLNKCTTITDMGLAEIASHCFHIKCLDLSKCKNISDKSLVLFEPSEKFTHIYLTNCSQITDQGLSALVKNCRDLKILALGNCKKLTDKSLEMIAAHCHQLEYLCLDNCSLISDEGIEFIAKACPNLRQISLNKCVKLTDQSLKYIATCVNLEEIRLGECSELTDQGFLSFKGLSKLKRINLQGCSKITSITLQILSQISLKEIDLAGCNSISNQSLSDFIKSVPHLQNLNLKRCYFVTDESLSTFSLMKLHTLDLSNCIQITDTGLSSLIQNCPTIQILDLSGCYIDKVFLELKNLKHLKKLNLSESKTLNDHYLFEISKNCPLLESLYLKDCKNITYSAMMECIKNFPNLKEINLMGCPLSAWDVCKIHKANPHIKIYSEIDYLAVLV